jgi:endonuclease YncB( thermonuclease family)
LFILPTILALSAQTAVAGPCVLEKKPEAVAVERAIDGDTLLLDDGREVRLAGVAAPKAPPGKAAADWPAGEAARAALDKAAEGRVLEFRPAASGQDRYGRLVGFLADFDAADHAGVSADLAAQGMLRITGRERDCDATLKAAEAKAIALRLGLWSETDYEVRSAADGASLASGAGRFVVAEGRVASVRQAAGRLYVNFGARWRDALSLTLSEAALRRLGGLNALDIKAGARLRVRGIVDARRSPVIAITDRGQIDRLDDGAAR